MIWVNLSGGLGNQIIQVCFASRLSSAVEAKVCLCSLDEDQSSMNPQVMDLINSLYLDFSGRPKAKIKRRVRRFLNFKNSRCSIVKEFDEDDFKEGLSLQSKHLIFDGYWQSAKNIRHLFEMDLNEYKKIFRISSFSLQMNLEGTCILHLRSGDYRNFLNKIIFWQQDINYYLEALKSIEDIASKRILVCSNGQWEETHKFMNVLKVRAGLKDSHIEIFAGDAIETFQLMLDCRYLVGSNSTFSLVAFILTKSTKRLGIFPKRWFRFFEHPLRGLSESGTSISLL